MSTRFHAGAAVLSVLGFSVLALADGPLPGSVQARADAQVGPAPVLRATGGGRSVSVTARFPGCQPQPGGDPSHLVCEDSPGAARASTRLVVRGREAVELMFDQPVAGLSGHLRSSSLRRTTPQFAGYQGRTPDRWVIVIPKRGLGAKRELVLNATMPDGRGPQWLVRLHRHADCR